MLMIPAQSVDSPSQAESNSPPPQCSTTGSASAATRALSRRSVLGVLVSGGVGPLAGCTTVLGSPKTDPTAESVPASGTDGPIEPPSEGSPAMSAAPSPGPSPGSEDETRDTAQAQVIEGPVESPASNVSPYADPADGLALTNLRLAGAESRMGNILRAQFHKACMRGAGRRLPVVLLYTHVMSTESKVMETAKHRNGFRK